MDAKIFVTDGWGSPLQVRGVAPYTAFLPTDLPTEMTLETNVIMKLSEADAALGRLSGAGRLLPNPHLLVSAYLTREAVASSRIEGTQASVTEVMEANVTGTAGSDDLREVLNYIQALNHGISRLANIPLSLRLIKEMHRILMTGVRGQEKTPGEFRRTQNWINSPDNSPTTAEFVPPPIEYLQDYLGNWELYLHQDRPRIPLLIRCALIHYQFETIHPFLDGNGRIGRLIIILYLLERDRLPTPLLYLSSYFDARKADYNDRLELVRERGEISQWLIFFLDAVTVQANDAITRAEQLSDLRESYRIQLIGSRTRAIEIVDLLMASPVLTVRSVMSELGRTKSISQPGASNLLRQLADLGILTRHGSVPGVQHRWFANDVLAILDP